MRDVRVELRRRRRRSAGRRATIRAPAAGIELRAQLGLDRGSSSSASLRPSRPTIFTPLSLHGLWLAETIAAGTPGALREERDRRRRTQHRATCTRAPSAAKPGVEVGLDARPRLACVAPDEERRPRRAPAPRRARARRPDGDVRSVSASPRTPSVPNRSTRRAGALPLRVLRRLAGLLEAVLATLLLARVTREQAGLLQRGPGVGIERDRARGRCRGGSRRPGRSRRRRRASPRRRRPLRSA